MNRVLVTMRYLSRRETPYFDRLREVGLDLVFNPYDRAFEEDELIAALPGVFATIAGSEPYNERVFAAAPDLRLVARFGVGHDKIDMAAATRYGVTAAVASGTNHDAAADFSFALMSALACRILPHHRTVVAGGWSGGFHTGLRGRTVGIVGLGRIGRAVAARCRGFDMRILGSSRVASVEEALRAGIKLVPLDELLAEADFVSLHTPRTPQTRNLIDAAELDRMKPTAFLINTARGGLVDEAALYEALTNGGIAGAGLDAFALEPPAGSPLLELENVVLSPHIGGLDIGTEAAMGERCTDHVLAVHQGRAPRLEDVLNPATLSA